MNTSIDEQQGLVLDPFAFHGHPESCIKGLGGGGPLPDPTYAFHTLYVAVARGHAHFKLRFTGLSARRGSLWLRIHMLPGAPGAVARMVTSHRLQLNWLAHHGGEAELRFEAFRGATYALMGLVPDDTDAGAERLSITLDRPGAPDDTAAYATGEVAPEAQRTAFHAGDVKTSAMLVSLDPPLFAHPVSQLATDAQLREPAFRERAGPQAGSEEWPAAYLLQVLDRYGALRPSARGLALGRGAAALADAITAAGASCQVVELASEDRPGAIDPVGLPGELSGFDFLLSLRATDTLSGDVAARTFLNGAMECLRPSGLAVHVVTFDDFATGPGLRFDRAALERAALGLISRGHEVARFKLASGLVQDPNKGVPFGLVARRAGSIL